jgi:hypothetical protein
MPWPPGQGRALHLGVRKGQQVEIISLHSQKIVVRLALTGGKETRKSPVPHCGCARREPNKTPQTELVS